MKFLEKLDGDETTAEYLLPTIVDQMIKEKRVDLTVLSSSDRWFGVIYKEDVPSVKGEFENLISEGVYKTPLFKSQVSKVG